MFKKNHLFQNFYWKKAFLSFSGLSFLLVLILVGIGILFIHSTDSETGVNYVKQIRWLVISIVAFAIISRLNYKWLTERAVIFYILGIITLIFLLACDPFVGKTKRWIKISNATIQPSEFIKYALVLILARLYSHFYKKNKSQFDIIPAFLLTIVPASLVFLQPDMGTSMVFFCILWAMAFVMGIPVRHLLLVLLLAFSVIYLYGLKPYQKQRIKSFFVPIFQTTIAESQKKGDLYQLMQSLNAHGSGGIVGKGLGKGHQNINHFLPAKKTDFIFSIIGEEWGFLGTFLVCSLFLLLYIFLLLVAYSFTDLEAKLIVVGITTILASQTIINIYVTLGLLPVTGIPLPFVSYGGSSLLSSFVGLGIIFSIQGNQNNNSLSYLQ